MDKKQRKDGLLLGSFVADALSLGAHWVYNTEKIKTDIPNLSVFHDPLSIYHENKKAGDFTHYGDICLFLLTFIKDYDFTKNSFEQDLSSNWANFISSYKGYLDHSNRESIKNYEQKIIPSGQDTISDLSASSRIAPLAYKFIDNQDELLKYSLIQTIMTNNTELCINATKVSVQILNDVFNGLSPKDAIENILKDNTLSKVHQYIKPALNSDQEDKKAIENFGPSCGTDEALTGALFFIIKYENDFEKALLQNVACGGDSATRGMLIGMILGAYLGSSKIPSKWIDSTKHMKEIQAFL